MMFEKCPQCENYFTQDNKCSYCNFQFDPNNKFQIEVLKALAKPKQCDYCKAEFQSNQLDNHIRNCQMRLQIEQQRQRSYEEYLEQINQQNSIRQNNSFQNLIMLILDSRRAQRQQQQFEEAKHRLIKYKAIQDDIEKSCTICLTDFELNEELVMLECSHKFHSHCLMDWLKNSPTCPICRKDV